jgi:hypothetical protein
MKFRLWVAGAALVIAGCASYKQLQPKPELSSVEGKYIELQKGEKYFELKKDKRYFIAFPPSQHDNFYLVLSTKHKDKFHGSFTSELLKKKTPGKLIADETPYPESISVYPISKGVPAYYWLIDKVKADFVLELQYRYTPQWRYKFETKHAAYSLTLGGNRVQRSVYEAVGATFHFDCSFNYPLVIDTVGKHTAALETVNKELLAIQSIFPPDIVNSKDEAYLNYKVLKKELEEEMVFQRNYRDVLDFFYKDCATRGKPLEYITRVDSFISYFSASDRFPANVMQESRSLVQRRLGEVPAYYDGLLQSKDDISPLDQARYRLVELNKVPSLYGKSGIEQPASFATMLKYLNDFDARARMVVLGRDSLDSIGAYVTRGPSMPSNDFFGPVVTRLAALQKKILPKIDQSAGTYADLNCTAKLNQQIDGVATKVEERLLQCKEAEKLVPPLNAMKSQGEFRTMLGLLRQNTHLGFLLDKYREVDKLSVDQQVGAIRQTLGENRWAKAEAGLRDLHADANFLDPTKIMPLKEVAVLDLEESLYDGIERASRARVNKFLEERVGELEKVDSLYTDSVFLPAYDVTFSSGGKQDLIRRKEQLVADLARMKANEFPAKAITLLYDGFMKNPGDNGVFKARAVVTHGKYYQGDDLKIKRRVAECDPWASKWITEPTEYRRVFAFPVTDNQRGNNKYVVRLNVRIPTEAKFPVYDVNIKLPKEVAKNAAEKQWYDEISLNKNLLKNEGRFTISAPTASNDNECQITPVQMNKDKDNVLHIAFTYPGFKPIPISVMVQKPIIKKN